ncbi:hypothetical protein J6590_107996, partial [Homalodisca vitripennis]
DSEIEPRASRTLVERLVVPEPRAQTNYFICILGENLLHLFTAHHVSRREPSRSDLLRKRPIYH